MVDGGGVRFELLGLVDEISGLISRVRSDVPPSREVSLAVTKLEEACLWLGAAGVEFGE